MPEGSTIVILKEDVQQFTASDNTKIIDTAILNGQKIIDFN